MSASNLILTLLILQTVFLLEPIVLLLFLWLLTYSLITGTPLETILRNVTVVEDDILLPYPPGFFNASDSADIEGDLSTCAADLDMSVTSSFDYSLSSMIDLEISCSVPAITVASGSAINLLEASSEHKFDLGPAEVVLECSSSNKACITSVFQSSGSSKVLNISEQNSTTSSSQPTTSMCHTELIAVEASPATSRTQQRSSKCLAQSIDIPADLDERPVFSRHIATGNVIFPVRKPPAVSKAPHDPFDINSLLKRMPASWAQKHRRDVPRSLRIAMSGVMDSSIFRREQKPAVVAGCDAYDSWPYIRTEVEQDIENDREKVEEDTFVSVLKWAVSAFRV